MTTIIEGYTRVTELLKPWQDFSAIPPEVLQAKSLIGTHVHEAISLYASGLPYQGLTHREEKYMESYKKWDENRLPQFLMSEERLYDHDLKLTGQIDSVVLFEGETQGVVLDFKCSLNLSLSQWKIQLGWYHILCAKNSIETMPEGCVLQLNDKGLSAQEYWFKFTDEDIQDCWDVYKAYRYFHPIEKEIENKYTI